MINTLLNRMPNHGSWVGLLSILWFWAAGSGCSSAIVRMIVTAPNHGLQQIQIDDRDPIEQWQNHPLIGQYRLQIGQNGQPLQVYIMDRNDRRAQATVIMIHGLKSNALELANQARLLVDAGYRAILVDLPGHGRSAGQYVSFGVHESQSISSAIDILIQRNQIIGPIGVYGHSMGGLTALQLAQRDRRIKAVVTVAAVGALQDIVQYAIHFRAPRFVAQAFGERGIHQVLDDIGQLGRFDPQQANGFNAIGRLDIPVLIVHGSDDQIVPSTHANRLFNATVASENTLLIVHGKTHDFDSIGMAEDTTNATRLWYTQHLNHTTNAKLAMAN